MTSCGSWIPPSQWPPEVEENSVDTVVLGAFNTLRREYGFRTHPWVSDLARSWPMRRSLVHGIVAEMNADVLALAEAELLTFEEDYADALTSAGYAWAHAKCKGKSDLASHSHTKPTVAWRARDWEMVWKIPRSRLVAVALRPRPESGRSSARLLVAVAVHLQGGPSDTARGQRLSQLQSVFSKIQARLGGQHASVVVMGDFNASPGEPVYRYALDAAEEDDAWDGHGLGLVNDFTHWTSETFDDVLGGARVPTFKWGTASDSPETPAAVESIDNILTTGDLVPLDIRAPFEQDVYEAIVHGDVGVPNLDHPSDHFPLVGRFAWTWAPPHADAADIT